MKQDRYGNIVSTASQAALDAYVEGVDLFLAAQVGADEAFGKAIAEDPSFALAHIALARSLQTQAKTAEAITALASARDLASGLSLRERAHISIIGNVIEGNGALAYQEILTHIKDHPRDAMVVQPCAGVFSLIGFSGRPGREAESLGFFTALQSSYGEDWWFNATFAFAQVETGQLAQAEVTLERAYAANPTNGNAAHYKGHLQYEAGEIKAGRRFIREWRKSYDRRALLHCHISWHEALWALEAGDNAEAWQIIEADVRPGFSVGPPINILTDMAAFLLRAELAGEARRDDLWLEISQYAATYFGNPGISFADAHAAIAHAMVGNNEALAKLEDDPAGPAGDMVKALAGVYRAFVNADWQEVITLLAPIMSTHERIGGSRAQRDLLEFTLLNALLKLGQPEQASLLLTLRRPLIADARYVAGLGA